MATMDHQKDKLTFQLLQHITQRYRCAKDCSMLEMELSQNSEQILKFPRMHNETAW